MLDDQASVIEAAQKTDIDSRQIDQVLHAARTWSHRLQSETEQTAALVALVERVELKCDGMGVSIKLPIACTEKSRAQLSDAVAITRSFTIVRPRRDGGGGVSGALAGSAAIRVGSAKRRTRGCSENL
jgi:hypothetical protein